MLKRQEGVFPLSGFHCDELVFLDVQRSNDRLTSRESLYKKNRYQSTGRSSSSASSSSSFQDNAAVTITNILSGSRQAFLSCITTLMCVQTRDHVTHDAHMPACRLTQTHTIHSQGGTEREREREMAFLGCHGQRRSVGPGCGDEQQHRARAKGGSS